MRARKVKRGPGIQLVCLSLLVVSYGFVAPVASLAGPKDEACAVDAIQALAGDTGVIQSATRDMTPAPHCKVEGYVTSPGGNKSFFRLQLPDDWAHRYYFIGMGGAAGHVPSESQSPRGNPMVKGFAVAGTDTGHQLASLDFSFVGRNREEAIDWWHRGSHLVAVATQRITKGFYGTDKVYRYHSGCSGGGAMGSRAITYHPEDFDGALLGAGVLTPNIPNYTMMMFVHMGQQLNREPGAFLTPAKLKLADEHVTKQCDALDGAKDGVVSKPGLCKFNFRQRLVCPTGTDGADCLTEPEIKTIEALLAGPGGLKPGWPISNMSTWTQYIGPTAPPWPVNPPDEDWRNYSIGFLMGENMVRAQMGPGFDPLSDLRFDKPSVLKRQVRKSLESNADAGWGSPISTNLRPFQEAGGKVIIWNGMSDPSSLDEDGIAYYKLAARASGGIENLLAFSRYYSIPGLGHCGGGTGPDDTPDRLLEALVDWVEGGNAPEGVVTHRGTGSKNYFSRTSAPNVVGVAVPTSDGSTREFLLCPYPKEAAFNNAPNGVFAASNWTCQPPAAGAGKVR